MSKKKIDRERAILNLRKEAQSRVDQQAPTKSEKKGLPAPKKFNRDRAILNLGIEAHRRVLKAEVMKFRLEAETLDRLLKFAAKCNKPAGTLVREWVIEKLDQEERGNSHSPVVMAISIITSSLAERGLLPDADFLRR